MDENNRNFILAIVLSIGVLFAWQFFFVPKHPPPVKPAEQTQPVEPGPPQPQTGGSYPGRGAATRHRHGPTMTREEAVALSPRIAIDTPSLKGSIALKGARIDDLTLKDYRETVEPARIFMMCCSLPARQGSRGRPSLAPPIEGLGLIEPTHEPHRARCGPARAGRPRSRGQATRVQPPPAPLSNRVKPHPSPG